MKTINIQLIIAFTVIIIICIVVILSFSFLSKPGKELNIQNQYEYLGKNAPIPTKLNPIVEEKKNTLINEAAKKNIDVVIIEGIRSFEKQNELYQQGRTTKGNIVTNTKAGESFHNYGLAFDYALLDASGHIIWNTQYDGNGNGKSDWFEVADIGKELGFDWGGDWISFKDYPHLQMTFGLSIDMLEKGYRLRENQREEAIQ
ncbi:M15 family metallopeptidase [Rummeliibacillus sp. JY-2-4R]